MKKRFTLLSTALLMGTSLSVFAQEQASPVDKAEWKEGNYFYLKSDNSGAVLSRYCSPVTLVPAANEFPETSFTILCTIAVPS